MSYKNPTGSNDLKSGTFVAYYLLNNIYTVKEIVSISLVRLVGTKMTSIDILSIFPLHFFHFYILTIEWIKYVH